MASAPVLYVKSPHPPSLMRHVKRELFALCRKQFAQERTVKAPGGGRASNFGPGASQVRALQSSHALSECPSRVPYAYRSIDRSGLVGHSLRVLEEDPSWANNWMPRGGISAGRKGNPGRAWEPGESSPSYGFRENMQQWQANLGHNWYSTEFELVNRFSPNSS